MTRLADMTQADWDALAAGDRGYTAVRPAVGTRVRVTFPATDWRDADTVTGTVTDRDHDSIEITPDGATIGEDFTLYDAEQSRGTSTVEVL